MRGWTKAPCHGCGEPDHEIGKVCRECQRLLDEAKATRERQSHEVEYGVYLHSDVPHWNPSYYDCPPGGDAHLSQVRDDLQEAITTLIILIAEPAPGQHRYPKTPVLVECDRTTRSYTGYGSTYGLLPFRLPVKVRAAINTLDTAIREIQKAAYTTGHRDGTNLLKQLAAGNLGQAEFDEKRRGHDR